MLTLQLRYLTFWLDEGTEGVEEPTVTVQFLLVLLLQAENDLDRAGSLADFAILGDNDA